ncbi:MAG: HAD-IA family hydrolase [Candidatus Omnitrophica bacterium]|nr:HAD-IA family hydrolase [Candidatus Omnitrophota bacterium]
MQQTRHPYRKHIFVCTNVREGEETCCSRRGSTKIRDALKRYVKDHGLNDAVRVSQSGCQGLCEEGPNVMVFPEGVWYHHVQMKDVEIIIHAHLEPFKRCEPASAPVAIRAFLFDLGNVLLPFDHMRIARRLAPFAKTSPERLYHMFFESPLQELHDEGKISGKEFYKKSCEKFGLNLSFEQFTEAWNDIFWEDPAMTEMVQKLRARYPVIGVSNTNQLHFDHAREHYPVVREIHTWILSHEVGARKPDPAIYKRAIAAAGVAPQEIFYMDDRLDLVEAGRRLGFVSEPFINAQRLILKLRALGIEI